MSSAAIWIIQAHDPPLIGFFAIIECSGKRIQNCIWRLRYPIGPSWIGNLGDPPVADLSLKQLAVKGQVCCLVGAEVVRANKSKIHEITKHSHAFTVSRLHGLNCLVHPSPGWMRESAFPSREAGAYTVSEHALHLCWSQVHNRDV
ncbi:Uncharacterised protein [uncultured archaeon]|nr:Uncharacterised protein [uncultured archaeon]